MSYIISVADYDLAYFSIPKAANTSVKAFIAQVHPDFDPNMTYRNIHQQLPWDTLTKDQVVASARDVLSFTVTRNPYTRLISTYNNKVCGRTLHVPFERLGFTKDMPFMDFLELVDRIPDNKIDIHLKSQWALLSKSWHLLPDLVVDMGELHKVQTVVRSVVEAKGGRLDRDIEVSNRSKPSKGVEDLLSESTESTVDTKAKKYRFKEIVETRFRRDIEVFGYEWPF